MRRLAAALLASAAVVIAGCGGSSAKSEEQAVRGVVHAFLADLGAGSANAACALLTSSGRSSLSVQFSAALHLSQRLSCSTVVRGMHRLLPAGIVRALRNARIGPVILSGSKATVDPTSITSPAGDLSVFVNQPVQLTKSSGRWLISSTT